MINPTQAPIFPTLYHLRTGTITIQSDPILTISPRVTKRLISRGHTLPQFHATSRPQIAEAEAIHRAIALATLTSTPILLVHMSSRLALHHARKAQSHLLPIHAETCSHYLHLFSSKLAETAQETRCADTGRARSTSVRHH
jgi:dihydroorotase-like cyclic amidohydrolase